MRGGEALLRTLTGAGVEVCFANPGTSEMHFVASLDEVPEMRGVLALFEGVATGAADGYGRMAGRPAATLLHLGPGLGNGLANLHNARRARTPLVNVVGDHATYHKRYDAPLESDIDALAGSVSGWVGRPDGPEAVGPLAAEAVGAAGRGAGRVATLILPADASWSEGAAPAPSPPAAGRRAVATAAVDDAAAALSQRSAPSTAILIGGGATGEAGVVAAARVANHTGSRLFCETFPARMARGGGLPEIERLAYLGEAALAQLDGVEHLVLAGASRPVSFFAYPNQPSSLVPDGCTVHVLAEPDDDAAGALAVLAGLIGAPAPAIPDGADGGVTPAPGGHPTGPLTPASAAAVIATLLPAGAVVVDEANTSGTALAGATAAAPRHDWLTLTGGAIGYGLPVSVGAAVACPERPVVCLESDGSAMYTLAALWTMAREQLDITVVVFANRAYAILNFELHRTGAGEGGEAAASLLALSPPDLDFVAMATGMGVAARRATTAPQLSAGLEQALAESGPHLIEAVLAPRS